MEKLREIQNKLDFIPFDGVVITILTFVLSPSEDKIKNSVMIGGAHYLLHNTICRIHTEDGLI